MHTLLRIAVMFALACSSSPVSTAGVPVEQVLPDALPEAVLTYLSDSTRAGFGPRLRGAWGPQMNRVAFVAWHPHPDGYQEHRLTVIEVRRDSAVVVAQDGGLGDAHWAEVRVFAAGSSAYLVGDIEDEYSLGIRILRVDSTGVLRDTQFPHIALPDTSEFASGPSSSALRAASLSGRDSQFRVEFSSELIVDPGTRDQAMLCPDNAGRPIAFTQTATGWTVSNGMRYPATGVANSMLTCASRSQR